MSDHPAHPDQQPERITRNARTGLVLFAIYVALYLGFMLLNAFAPQRMREPVSAGVNLAIVYGMGLIFAAFALAMIYMLLCGKSRSDDQQPAGR